MANESGSFSNPHEELAYLRSKVLETEKRLERFGVNKPREEIVKSSIEDYKNEVLPNLTPAHHAEAENQARMVGGLEDKRQLDEMMKVAESKGVMSALVTVEKMKGWKLEDDFHDFLADLIAQGLPFRGLKETGPEYKALHMTLYEVVLPKTETSDKPFVEIVKSMEQLYAGFLSIPSAEQKETDYMVFEMANPEGEEDASIFVSVPTDRKVLFEKQVLSIFPNARLIVRSKDYNIFNSTGVSVGSSLKLAESPAYPLLTAESFGEDPMNVILSSFAKISKFGSGAALQIVFKPKGKVYTEKFSRALEKIKKGEKPKEVLEEVSFTKEFGGALKDFIFSSKAKSKDEKEKAKSQNAQINVHIVEAIQKKLESPTVETNIRLIACAQTEPEARRLLDNFESAFNQFENTGKNHFVFERTKVNKESDFYRAFTFRLFRESEITPLNLKELSAILHFHTEALIANTPLTQNKAKASPAPHGLINAGTFIGVNNYQGHETSIYMSAEDRLRHFYVVGQTGTGKSVFLKNLIMEDIRRGDGVCFIDPHGSDVQDILAQIPKERMEDVIYFDPAYIERPMALNMLEYDGRYPEQKTAVVNELLGIFNKLFDMKTAGGPMFELYFRNAVLLTIDDPNAGASLVDVSRIFSNKEYRDQKIATCKNPLVVEFWKETAQKAGGEGKLENMVPYIVSKFDNFLSNDIMRPVIAQSKSSFNFREVMDNKKILLVNLSKGRLGELNANLIGLILVGKILMAALSRADSHGVDFPPFYLYIDEFQNITSDSIASILSEARKYKLSLNVAHQFIKQLKDEIRDAVFGNVGSMAIFRVGSEDAEFLEKQLSPVFTATDIQNIDNLNAYVKILSNGIPQIPFNISIKYPERTEEGKRNAELLKQMSYLKYGGDRAEIEEVIRKKFEKLPRPEII
ncbi:MAG: DUF87 domain-containing protein [Minisyncoccia bacterium]